LIINSNSGIGTDHLKNIIGIEKFGIEVKKLNVVLPIYWNQIDPELWFIIY